MPPQEQIKQLQTDLDKANKRVSDLERISIQAVIDPTTFLYLKSAILSVVSSATTSTYSSSSAPSGTAATGSTWYQDGALLSDRKIFVYTGSGWQQFK